MRLIRGITAVLYRETDFPNSKELAFTVLREHDEVYCA
jgi:hypothetical protein